MPRNVQHFPLNSVFFRASKIHFIKISSRFLMFKKSTNVLSWATEDHENHAQLLTICKERFSYEWIGNRCFSPEEKFSICFRSFFSLPLTDRNDEFSIFQFPSVFPFREKICQISRSIKLGNRRRTSIAHVIFQRNADSCDSWIFFSAPVERTFRLGESIVSPQTKLVINFGNKPWHKKAAFFSSFEVSPNKSPDRARNPFELT